MRKKAIATISLGVFVFLLFIYIFAQSGARIIEEWHDELQEDMTKIVQKSYSPGIYYSLYGKEGEDNWLKKQLLAFFPYGKYIDDKSVQASQSEDMMTYLMILEQQAKDDERFSEDLTSGSETLNSTTVNASVMQKDLSLEKLRDFNYLISTLYTVDSTTTIGPEQLNADTLLKKDMHINQSTKGPKVLIFHTHSQETFADSKEGDANTGIVGMGAYLADRLNALGIETIHHDGVYDIIDGKLDRSKAYEMSEKGVKKILNQFPSIEVVIDLHRDGVREDLHLITDINGKQTAKLMFFNGLSRTKTNGNIDYLYNPYIEDNLSFSLQMQLAMEEDYPGLTRRIYLKGYRYSLHMMPKSLLIEAGAQTNTVAEVENAMDLLANTLNKVLTK